MFDVKFGILRNHLFSGIRRLLQNKVSMQIQPNNHFLNFFPILNRFIMSMTYREINYPPPKKEGKKEEKRKKECS